MNISNYVKPKSLDEAYDLLNASKKNHIIAGGAWLKLSLKSAENLISLENLDLNFIKTSKDFIEIGATTTLREVETNETIKTLHNGILSQSLSKIMGINIRNIATLGGSVMGKFSFSDIIPVLLTMDTKLVFFNQGEITLEEFLLKPKLNKDILIKIIIKNQKGKGFFKKVATTPLDFAIINIACTCISNKITISVGSTPAIAKICYKAMEYINNKKAIKATDIDKCAEIALEELKFSDNLRASKEYRKDLTKVYITRGIKQVINYES